jgi:nitrite reductase/ring-hydroxylating ferredoxin subunit
MADFVRAARVDQVPAGRGWPVTIDGKELALFNVDGTIYAIDDTCLHQGLSLAMGEIDGPIVTCRGHGWRYDVRTGNTTHVPDYGVETYPVKIEGDDIMVSLIPTT